MSIGKVFSATVFLSVLCAPGYAYAAITITEIFYDAPGSDANHEWIEIYNSGPDPVTLSSWRLLEDGVRHHLTVSADPVLPPFAYAVIAEDPSTFVVDFPHFQGMLIDSAFSLGNTSDTIALEDASVTTVETVSYSKEIGGDGTGGSIGFVDGNLVHTEPSPGLPNVLFTPPPVVHEEEVVKRNLEPAVEVPTEDTKDQAVFETANGDAESLPAAAALSSKEIGGVGLVWIIALLSTILVGIAALFFGSSRNTSGYTVIEEHE